MTQPLFRVYIAVSLDGYIATLDGRVDWLKDFEAEDYGYQDFIAGIGILIMGRATYEQALGFGAWPYPGKRVAVLTGRPLAAPPSGVEAVSREGLPALIKQLGAEAAGDIWIVGGGRTIEALLGLGAVDRLELYVMPVLLGAGLSLFPETGGQAALALEGVRPLPRGVVELIYTVAPNAGR